MIALMAEEGIAALAARCRAIAADPGDREARADALYGAWLCGTAGPVGMALHHKLCHTLGGSFNLPHAETHTVVLPHALAYNAAAAPAAMPRSRGRWASDDAGRARCSTWPRTGRRAARAARHRHAGRRPRPRRRPRARQSILEPAPAAADAGPRAAARAYAGEAPA